MEPLNRIKNRLEFIYSQEEAQDAFVKIQKLINKWEKMNITKDQWVDESDVILITYGDSIKREGEKPLVTLNKFMSEYFKNEIKAVHLLPMFPYTSDDGFSVVDYKKINPDLGDWNDIENLSGNFDLMFDSVINHISKSSDWFQGYLNGDKKYENYFIECDPEQDYSMVTRPRALPLLTPFETSRGTKHIWTTFSDDQIDINFECVDVLVDILDILVTYAYKGARYIRFDAIGFIWKELGTTCMHHPKAHEIIKLMRDVLDIVAKGTIIITETNVPHKDNISYFGNGYDEAHMVYQFPLPPLTLYSFLAEDATKLSKWADSLENTTDGTTFFNFLASHDGIGLRPTEGILTDDERQLMVDKTLATGGKVNFKNNPDGSKSPYELNINYMDALTPKDSSSQERIARFMAAQTILLSVVGVPAIYVHSLLGSRNWEEGVEISGINRRINREQLDYSNLIKELHTNTERKGVTEEFKKLLTIRKEYSAFSPAASQQVVNLDNRVFSTIRENEKQRILVIVNVSNDEISINTSYKGIDLITGNKVDGGISIQPLGYLWIKLYT